MGGLYRSLLLQLVEPLGYDRGVIYPADRGRLARLHAVASVRIAVPGDEPAELRHLIRFLLEQVERPHDAVRRFDVGGLFPFLAEAAIFALPVAEQVAGQLLLLNPYRCVEADHHRGHGAKLASPAVLLVDWKPTGPVRCSDLPPGIELER